MKSFILAMKNYFNFKGTTTRSEFWFFVLQYTIIQFIIALIYIITKYYFLYFILALFNFALMIPYLAIRFRRLHDAGFSAWCIFIPIFNIILYCYPSAEEKYPNKTHNIAKNIGLGFFCLSIALFGITAVGVGASIIKNNFSQYSQSTGSTMTKFQNLMIISKFKSQHEATREKLIKAGNFEETKAEFYAEQKKIIQNIIDKHKDNPNRQSVVKYFSWILKAIDQNIFTKYQFQNSDPNEIENIKIIDDFMANYNAAKEKALNSANLEEANAEFISEQKIIIIKIIEEHKDNPDRQSVVKYFTWFLEGLDIMKTFSLWY